MLLFSYEPVLISKRTVPRDKIVNVVLTVLAAFNSFFFFFGKIKSDLKV